MPRPADLPPFYYYDHFTEMLAFVVRLYGAMLGDEERDFIDDFDRLDREAQCLYIRLCNRKRTIFSRADLQYSEIGDMDGTIAVLKDRGWLRPVSDEDYSDLLSGLTKPVLLERAKAAGAKDIKSSWSKGQLVEWCQSNIPFCDFIGADDCENMVVPCRKDTVAFLLYLYFGRLNDGLTGFALRDLGIAATNARDSFSARFQDLDEARGGFFYSNAIRDMKLARPGIFARLAETVHDLPAAATDYVRTLRDGALHMLGLYYERGKEPDRAIALYGHAESFECRERLVRLLYAAGEKERVSALLEGMIAAPSCDEEHFFAGDFLARKFNCQKVGIYTGLLRESSEISIDEFFRGTPEYAAIRHFKRQGWTGVHTENMLWNSLFGLIFWDELFERPGAMASAFDFLPSVLRHNSFVTLYAADIELKLQAVRGGQAAAIVESAYDAHDGTPNGVFGWFDELRDIVTLFASKAPGLALATMLEKMAQNYLSTSDGFPDLLLVRGNDLKFVEIKAEGDQLRRHQLARLMQLRHAGFQADICRVLYHIDPEQVYVVVDVETTGGRPPFDRVTEIGAVKIQNGVVIDRWQSLINPERNIPSMITSLTGISNAMVADAPRFADVADELAEFLDGCVFAAHNVNFDYGFIASEFRRLEMPFRHPKICTCSSMRKHYPGLNSYSLGNLCREFGIALDNHHRALCDAEAAAQLLILVNEKRLNNQRQREAA